MKNEDKLEMLKLCDMLEELDTKKMIVIHCIKHYYLLQIKLKKLLTKENNSGIMYTELKCK